MPKEIQDCVKAILEENPDLTESDAWAICTDQYNKKHKDSEAKSSREELVLVYKKLFDKN